MYRKLLFFLARLGACAVAGLATEAAAWGGAREAGREFRPPKAGVAEFAPTIGTKTPHD